MENAKNTLIRTFGRVHGKKLSTRQQMLIETVLPIVIPDSLSDDAILEIGFGAGEHLMELAINNPNKIIIGAEPFMNGVASLLAHITDVANVIKPEFKNIRIWPDDIRKLISVSKMHTLNQIYVLHPDPWPKARHEKRRLLSAELLKTLSSLISKDGKIFIGTDHTDYYNWIIDQVKATNLQISSTEIDVIKTRYQEKNMFGSLQTNYLVLTNS
jgi:tRNA (guanine-N7-)-methyltransferase